MHSNSTKGSWVFKNAISEACLTPVAIGAILINRSTREELLLDILCESDRFDVVTESIRKFYSRKEWEIFETWAIDQSNDFTPSPDLETLFDRANELAIAV